MCETVCTRMPRELAEELLQSIHLLHIIEEHNGFELLPAEIDWAEVAEIEHEAEITILVDELDSVQKSLTETTVQLEQTIIDREHLREDVQRLININQKLVAEIDRLKGEPPVLQATRWHGTPPVSQDASGYIPAAHWSETLQ